MLPPTLKKMIIKIWTVKLKRAASPTQGLVEGLTVSVTTQQNCHDYPSLRKALNDSGLNVDSVGGIWTDDYWDWR